MHDVTVLHVTVFRLPACVYRRLFSALTHTPYYCHINVKSVFTLNSLEHPLLYFGSFGQGKKKKKKLRSHQITAAEMLEILLYLLCLSHSWKLLQNVLDHSGASRRIVISENLRLLMLVTPQCEAEQNKYRNKMI